MFSKKAINRRKIVRKDIREAPGKEYVSMSWAAYLVHRSIEMKARPHFRKLLSIIMTSAGFMASSWAVAPDRAQTCMKALQRINLNGDYPYDILYRGMNLANLTNRLLTQTANAEVGALKAFRQKRLSWSSLIPFEEGAEAKSLWVEKDWLNYAKATQRKTLDFRGAGNVEVLSVGENERVFKVISGNKTWFMRPRIYEALFVDEVCEALRVDFASHATVGYLPDGEFGVFSEEVPGERLGAYVGPIRAESLLSAIAMSYLFGMRDTNLGNFKVEGNGNIGAYDFTLFEPVDSAQLKKFQADANTVYLRQLGYLLPPRYSRRFIENLKNLTPQQVTRKWSALISPGELKTFLLRREVILEDSAKRGSAILFDP